MLVNLLRFDDFGTELEIKYLLFEAIPFGSTESFSTVETLCRDKSFRFSTAFLPIIYLLKEIDIITVDTDNNLAVNMNSTEFDEIKSDFHRCIEIIFLKIMELINSDATSIPFFSANALTYDTILENIILKENFIPLSYSGLKKLFINLGVFTYDENINGLLLITPQFIKYFERNIIPEVRKKRVLYDKSSKLSQEELIEILKHKEVLGEEAEQFILRYEQNRLSGHSLYNSIKIISHIDVQAGYDIISFNEMNSNKIDRFIEVKSFKDSPYFYWTKKEIEISKIKSENYFLYLVDRSKMQDENYEPIIIKNPFQEVYQSKSWLKDSQLYYCIEAL